MNEDKKIPVWHILPIKDLKDHKEASSCRCNPKVFMENGTLIVAHNSFDGREGVEWVNQILKQK